MSLVEVIEDSSRSESISVSWCVALEDFPMFFLDVVFEVNLEESMVSFAPGVKVDGGIADAVPIIAN